MSKRLRIILLVFAALILVGVIVDVSWKPLPYRFMGKYKIVRTWRHGPWMGYLIKADLKTIMKEAEQEFTARGFPKQDYIDFPHPGAVEYSRMEPDVWFTDNVDLVDDPSGYSFSKEGGHRNPGYCLFFCEPPPPSFVGKFFGWVRGLFQRENQRDKFRLTEEEIRILEDDGPISLKRS